MGRLAGKVILITGGASGQGKACAELFAQEGAQLILTDIQETVLAETVQALNDRYGDCCIGEKLDVASEEDWKHASTKGKEVFGKIDGLINSAGITGNEHHDISKISTEEWQQVFDVNALGNFLGIKHVTPIMAEKGGGSIVNISSIAAMHTSLGLSAYGASKGATRVLTKGAAVTLGKQRIRVNSIHPGVIKTPMSQPLMENEMLRNRFLSRIPLGDFGDPLDIAYAALFLASDEAKFISGAEIVIDGGQTVS